MGAGVTSGNNISRGAAERAEKSSLVVWYSSPRAPRLRVSCCLVVITRGPVDEHWPAPCNRNSSGHVSCRVRRKVPGVRLGPRHIRRWPGGWCLTSQTSRYRPRAYRHQILTQSNAIRCDGMMTEPLPEAVASACVDG